MELALRLYHTMAPKLRILISLLALSLFSSPYSYAEYLAYAVGKKGQKPLPEYLEPILEKTPEELVVLKWGEYSGPKSRVGILPVENDMVASSLQEGIDTLDSSGYSRTTQIEQSIAHLQIPIAGIDALISDVLQSTNRFVMLERNVLQDVITEQDFTNSGRVNEETQARENRLVGVNYFIKAVITAYEPNYAGNKIGGGGLGGGLLGGVGVSNKKSMVQMVFRLIDTETAEIVFSKRVEVIMRKSSFSLIGGGGGNSGGGGAAFSSFSKSLIGKAMIAAINAGAYELVKQIGAQPVAGKVIQVRNNSIFVNLGADLVSKEDKFQALSLSEELIDPDTGLSLGRMEETLGLVSAVTPGDKFTIMQALDFEAALLKTGDKILSLETPDDFEFAPAWNMPAQSNSVAQSDSGSSGEKKKKKGFGLFKKKKKSE